MSDDSLESPSSSTPQSLLPVLPALLGVVLCAMQILAIDGSRNSLSCATVGCTLYGGSALTWLAGLCSFLVLFIVPFLSRALGLIPVLRGDFLNDVSKRIMRILTFVGLVLDLPLLALLLATSPCLLCLCAGCLLFLCFIAVHVQKRREQDKPDQSRMGMARPMHNVLMTVWLVLFTLNSGVAANELFTRQWSISGDIGTADVIVYFSPSCTYCLSAIKKYEGKIGVALVPVAHTEADFEGIAGIVNAMQHGVTVHEAMLGGARRSVNPLLRLRVLANTAQALRSGTKIIPLVEFRGVPADTNGQSNTSNLRLTE